MASAICIINEKGGSGKSSTTFHMAGALAADGLRVLLVDVDPQASLSRGFFGRESVDALPAAQTVAALFDDESFSRDDDATMTRSSGQPRFQASRSRRQMSS